MKNALSVTLPAARGASQRAAPGAPQNASTQRVASAAHPSVLLMLVEESWKAENATDAASSGLRHARQ
jgi:hypothetical protein